VALYYLAIELARKAGRLESVRREYWQDQIRLAHEVTRQFLDTQQTNILDLVEEYQSAANIFILGAGPNVGTRKRIKVIEMARVSDGCDMEVSSTKRSGAGQNESSFFQNGCGTHAGFLTTHTMIAYRSANRKSNPD
jgi:hypothetical protein